MVGVLDVFWSQFAPLVLGLLLLVPLLLGLLLLLLLPLKVLSCFQPSQWPPALHLLGAEDGKPRPGTILRHVNCAFSGRLCCSHHVTETQLDGP